MLRISCGQPSFCAVRGTDNRQTGIFTVNATMSEERLRRGYYPYCVYNMRKKHIAKQKLYFLMNKAPDTVCSTVSDSHSTVYDVFPKELLVSPEGAKLHTIGRLDLDTAGLLLFTNDGKLSDFLTRPENKIEKTYFVCLKKNVTPGAQKIYTQAALNGLLMPPEKKAEEQMSGPATLNWLSDDSCNITLTEGKFHEVKRIFRALGNEVIYLKRIKMAGLSLDETIKSGEFRPLTDQEVELLKQYCH